MVSFDLTSWYTDIPIIDTLNIINDYVNKDNQCTRKTAIPEDKFFNSQFYQQTDGVAMWCTASSTTAEIDTQAYERTSITAALHPQKVWERFVDDVYSILNTILLLWRKKVTVN